MNTTNFLFIVLELAEAGELFDEVIKKMMLKKAEAELNFFQIDSAFKYLHFKKNCHRSLKPENLLVCSSNGSLVNGHLEDHG